ncbi:MAG: NAD(P)/FAD-dependent oxidoreductase [Clostridia bacterium]|nr:NAD(P)/FAD-dependent oxidoreductase [Clostridia bacterium]
MQDVVIIGAGPAGLSAAYKLLKQNKNLNVTILEASGHIGGISRTQVFEDNRMDLGGHRFFTKSKEVMDLWTEIMPLQGAPSKDDILLNREVEVNEGGPDPEATDKVLLRRRRISRIYFLKKFFDYPLSLKMQTFANMGLLRTLNAGFGYVYASIFKRPEKTLEDFYINRFGKPLYEMFFEGYTEKVWGIHPSEISPDWGAQRVKGLSLFKALLNVLLKPFKKSGKVETSLIEEFFYPAKGPGSLYEHMHDEIVKMGGNVELHRTVNKIETSENEIMKIWAEDEKGSSYEYNPGAVFSSMPVKDLIYAAGSNAPSNVAEIADNLPYRDFMTVGLLVDSLAIKNNSGIKTISDIVPDCWIYVQDRDVRLGRVQIFNNWSPYMVSDYKETVFIGLEYFCSEGDELWTMKDSDFIQMAIEEVSQIGMIKKESVLKSTLVRQKKAYPAYFGAYKDFDKVKAYLDTLDNLYCIGRNGQHRYNNMDHSILTGMHAVDVYLSGSKNKEQIWQINTEEEYHETSKE